MAADQWAHRLGLYPGMPLAKAQAMVPGLDIRPFTPQADAADLDALALWALRALSPLVACDAPDGLVLDITGCAHLHGGESGLAQVLLAHLENDGIAARLAVADSWGAAHALARFAPAQVTIVPPGDSRRRVLDLPLGALRLEAATVQGLDAMGFETIGDLTRQPRAPLVHRFGAELGRRLDQVLGDVAEPIDPVVLPDVITARRVFAEPIGAAETIARYTGKLTQQLCDALENRGLGARRLDLVFHRNDNRVEAIRIGTAAPVRDVKRLTRLLCDKIETVDPGFGIERMALTATVTEPLTPRQADTEAPEVPELSGLIDILGSRLGAQHIYRLAPVQSDVPERATRRSPPLAPVRDEARDKTRNGEWPRPQRLLARAEPITTLALLPDNPPKMFVWRGLQHRVVRADGPERIHAEWGRHSVITHGLRDYFRVEDEAGRRFWIFRAGDGEHKSTGKQGWFMHGIFA